MPKTNINNRELRSLALVNIRMAINFSTPALSSAVTMLNIPKRNPITSRLIDLSADSKEITLKISISMAPISIDAQIGI
jgi:hypothetical protein